MRARTLPPSIAKFFREKCGLCSRSASVCAVPVRAVAGNLIDEDICLRRPLTWTKRAAGRRISLGHARSVARTKKWNSVIRIGQRPAHPDGTDELFNETGAGPRALTRANPIRDSASGSREIELRCFGKSLISLGILPETRRHESRATLPRNSTGTRRWSLASIEAVNVREISTMKYLIGLRRKRVN